MHETTYDLYNKLMNHLFEAANAYYAIATSAMVSGMEGVYYFAINESHERWHYGDKVNKYLLEAGERPDITGHEAPRQDYANPVDALTVMLGYEAATIKLLNDTAMVTVENDPLELEKMGRWKRKMMKEWHEINRVDLMYKFPGATIAGVDSHLKEKYECMVKGDCTRHKY